MVMEYGHSNGKAGFSSPRPDILLTIVNMGNLSLKCNGELIIPSSYIVYIYIGLKGGITGVYKYEKNENV